MLIGGNAAWSRSSLSPLCRTLKAPRAGIESRIGSQTSGLRNNRCFSRALQVRERCLTGDHQQRPDRTGGHAKSVNSEAAVSSRAVAGSIHVHCQFSGRGLLGVARRKGLGTPVRVRVSFGSPRTKVIRGIAMFVGVVLVEISACCSAC
jgi:hypothetical protein